MFSGAAILRKHLSHTLTTPDELTALEITKFNSTDGLLLNLTLS